MDLGQPHRIETPALGSIDLFEGDRERILVGHPGGALKLVEHAELERHHLPPSSPPARRPALAQRAAQARATAKLREETAARRVKKGAANPPANMAALPRGTRVRRRVRAGGEIASSAPPRLRGRS